MCIQKQWAFLKVEILNGFKWSITETRQACKDPFIYTESRRYSVQAAYARTHFQAAQRGCCDERTARGTSCSFVALHSMHAHSTSPHSMHAHETGDQNLRWRHPLQPF